MEEIPADVRALQHELVRRGFTVGEERHDNRFANRLVVLKRKSTAIRLVRDRRQWFIEVAAEPFDDWSDPIVWHAFVEAAQPSLEAPAFDAQARLLLDDLSRIEKVTSEISDRGRADLRALRRQRATARRAMPRTS